MDSKSCSPVEASIRITDGFFNLGSAARFVKTVVARRGSKAKTGALSTAPRVRAAITADAIFFMNETFYQRYASKILVTLSPNITVNVLSVNTFFLRLL